MSEELETQETTEELDDLDVSLFENEDETPEEETTIEIDGEPVKLSDVEKIYKDYSNDENWKATNTQKAQEIAQEKQRLEEEKNYIEQLRRDAELLLQQKNYQQPQQTQTENDPYYGVSQDEWEDMTPTEQRLVRNQYEQKQSWDSWLKQNEQKEFWNQTQSEHQKLKSLYPDYDGSNIERAIIQGRNQFEDVHLAETFKRIKNGDPETIRSMIPENVLSDIKKQARDELIQDLRKKEAQRRKIASPQPEKGGLGKIPDSKPINQKSYRDIRSDVLNTLKDENISLFQ